MNTNRMLRRKKIIILVSLAISNLLGSGSLALYGHRRFLWPAIGLPALFLFLALWIWVRGRRET
jgi:hypothetical protein